jgi:hypothetical protein
MANILIRLSLLDIKVRDKKGKNMKKQRKLKKVLNFRLRKYTLPKVVQRREVK